MAIEYSRSKKARRKFKLLNLIRLIGGILIVFLILEGILLVIANISVKPVTVKWGLIEKGYWTEALFLRNEKILVAPSDGYLVTRAEPGTRVENGELIAYISEERSSQSSSTETDSLNMRIRLSNLNRQKQDMLGDLQRIREQIRYKYNNSHKLSKKIKDDLDSLEQMQIRSKAALKQIEDEINKITAKLKKDPNNLSIITAPQPGYLFYQVDHWEEKMTPEQFFNLTEIDLRRNYIVQSFRNPVKTGDIIGKIIDPFRQLIIITLNPQLFSKPPRNEIWWLKTNEREFQVTVVDSFSLSNGKTVIELEDTIINNSFLPNRRAKVYIIYRRIEGISIPVKALFRKGAVTRVKVMNGGDYRMKDVQVLETDGDKAIVKGIEFGTIIISR